MFVGTRAPVRTFLDYLQGGYSLDEFLDHFPSVRREQAVSFLKQAAQALLTEARRPPKRRQQSHDF